MTVQEIKSKYAHYEGIKNARFLVDTFADPVGEAVVIIEYDRVCGEIWRDVAQVVRVSDGAEMLAAGRRRPCDNLRYDAYDVAAEMLSNDWEERERQARQAAALGR